MILTLLAGIWEGPVAITFGVLTDKGRSVLVAANYLPSPWCYVAAVTAAVVAFAVIAFLETRRKKVMPPRNDPAAASRSGCLLSS